MTLANMFFHIVRRKVKRLFAYEYNGYWKDVGTLGSYWEANMELIDIIPEFNLYEEFWKIIHKGDIIPPQYISRRCGYRQMSDRRGAGNLREKYIIQSSDRML